MRALFIASGRQISPFGDPASQMVFVHERIGDASARACRRHGAPPLAEGEAPGDGPLLVLMDHVYVSEKLLGDFLKAARAAGKPACLAVDRTASVDFMLPLSDARALKSAMGTEIVAYDVFYWPGGALPSSPHDALALRDALREACEPLITTKKERTMAVRLPTLGEDVQHLDFPLTSSLCCHLTHWVHVLWLNQLALTVHWMELMRNRPLTFFPKMLWALLRNGFRKRGLMARVNHIHPTAKVHPSAHLELSFVGEGAEIGAGVTLRNAFVGPRATVSDHASVVASVIGEDALVPEATFLLSCTSFPKATVGNWKLQVCLIGEGAYVNHWAGFVDAKFQGSIQVHHDGALVSTERSFLGSCLGHRAVVGGKILIQPGREIPNDAIVVMRPDEVISEVPEGLPERVPLVRHEGRLVPLAELKAKAEK